MIRDRAIVDVWLASLDDEVRDPEQCLAPDELMRARSFVDRVAARRYVAGRANLRHILATYLNCSAAGVQFQYGQFGKPLLSGSHAGELHFNVSHADELAACAICTSADVGIDIERDDGRIDPQELAPMICSADELRQFRNCPPEEQRDSFFRLWTRKEAYIKCIGRGFSLKPNQVDVSLSDAPEVTVGAGDLRCSIRTLPIVAPFYLSVASNAATTEVQRYAWWPTGTAAP